MQLDLNLLTALDALLEEGSVAGAAARLHVTAPAMSRTLGRIRKATGDPVLVRSGHTMVPTAHALALREEVHDLVHRAHAVLSTRREIDLATLERVFTVRWHDALTAACGPALVAAVHRQAPGVRLRLVAESSSDTPELRRGEVDLASGTGPSTAPDVISRLLGEDRLVVALRTGHPLTARPLTAERYAAAGHLTVSRRGRLHDPVDAALEGLGLRRTVVAAAPSAATALQLARETDLLVTVPGTIIRTALDALGLTTHPLPVPMAPIPVHLMWHRRHDNDQAHRWLREQACAAVEAVLGPPPPAS
ncbi:LysR family transcriptional regulator [Streptomyces sp. B3I8]|uniref:LysR family transcriptional regulator n=1 Tax=Streptomyces sp. B3I8 TaxID=3042303 RepID=UPI00278B9BFD|nr:LysR family transcriptional regulator [Streptomyces sp. B3I8]MDQ0791244.1 DNA-binding transcriptional LysR family regulator [Streptomyces sp. B3I8]